jgi:hypothetical protein
MSKILSRALAAALLCAAATAVPAAPPKRGPAANVASGDASALLAQPRFAKAWYTALGADGREAWLAERDGPAPEPRWVRVAGKRYVLNAFCKPHDCFDHNAVLLYDPQQASVYGLLHRPKRDTLVGAPPPELAAALHRLWLGEWRQHLK